MSAPSRPVRRAEARAVAKRTVYTPHGAALTFFMSQDPEVVIVGPAGTGKSRAALEKMHYLASNFPGFRGLIVRKTRESITSSVQTIFERAVIAGTGLKLHSQRQRYEYANGSFIAVGGLADAGGANKELNSRVMSSEYDVIFVNEATELTEAEWESLTSRMAERSSEGRAIPWSQMMGDCNPSHPQHWLRRRMDAGITREIVSTHADNPTTTPEYFARLARLTGVRRLRLLEGKWAASEGIIYGEWDDKLHLVPPDYRFPDDWRVLWSVDFGFTKPFVWQQWRLDGDKRLYLQHEIYMTRRIVEDHAPEILRISAGDPPPDAVICDHDAEDRATLERHIKHKTLAAKKAISPGIQAVKSRLRVQEDGKPRLFIRRDACAEKDSELVEAKQPACTYDEIMAWEWDTSNGRKKGEVPIDEYNHGQDAKRYTVAHVDKITQGARGNPSLTMVTAPSIWVGRKS